MKVVMLIALVLFSGCGKNSSGRGGQPVLKEQYTGQDETFEIRGQWVGCRSLGSSKSLGTFLEAGQELLIEETTFASVNCASGSEVMSETKTYRMGGTLAKVRTEVKTHELAIYSRDLLRILQNEQNACGGLQFRRGEAKSILGVPCLLINSEVLGNRHYLSFRFEGEILVIKRLEVPQLEVELNKR